MKRREFIMLVGSAAASVPFAARAQPAKLPTIGFLGSQTQSAQSEWTAAFLERMGKHGWIDGRTIAIEYRWGEGRSERLAEIAAEFVRLKVSIIVTAGTAAVIAVKQATSVIPIVFGTAGDPVGTGLVASLARPGGNVTGLSNQSADLAGKRIELLREVVPGLRRLAIAEIRQAQDIPPAIEALKGRADALYVVTEPLVNTNRIQINALALAARLPTLHGQGAYVKAGGLMSYGANIPDLFRRAADYVDKILRGAKPADLPVEQPTKFDLIINARTAKALGLDLSPTLLARADQVIE
jgi:putative ABC transport system substrate-binding protein